MSLSISLGSVTLWFLRKFLTATACSIFTPTSCINFSIFTFSANRNNYRSDVGTVAIAIKFYITQSNKYFIIPLCYNALCSHCRYEVLSHGQHCLLILSVGTRCHHLPFRLWGALLVTAQTLSLKLQLQCVLSVHANKQISIQKILKQFQWLIAYKL